MGRQTKSQPQPYQADGWRSDTSLASLGASLLSAEQLWQGADGKGIRSLLGDDQKALAEKIAAAYADARAKLEALDPPLSKLLQSEEGLKQLNVFYDSLDVVHRLHSNELARVLNVLALGSLLLGAVTLGGWTLSRKGRDPLLLSARDDADGGHYAVGYRLDGNRVFATRVAQRCHDIVEHPSEAVALFVARRPGTESYLIDLTDGSLLQTVKSLPNRHFYGHGVFHRSGEWLYTTDNDTSDPGRGLLGVYAYADRRLVHQGELSTHGLGPHQVSWMPDGETFVVANGGIRTEAESRVEMNLNAMEP
eukprot:gene48255-59095_t